MFCYLENKVTCGAWQLSTQTLLGHCEEAWVGPLSREVGQTPSQDTRRGWRAPCLSCVSGLKPRHAKRISF